MFLDHASTTKIHKSFLNAINAYEDQYANPSSNHKDGLKIRSFMDAYRKRILKLVNEFYNTEFTHFILTSGATESINTVFHAFGVDSAFVTTEIEHKAALESVKKYSTYNKQVNFINLQDPSKSEIDKNWGKYLISIMTVNNETGSILDPKTFLEPVYDIIKNQKSDAEIYTHCDNTQGFMKTKLDLHNYDMMTFSGHKIGTFKGIGGLFLNDRAYEQIKKNPLLVGGSQQEGIRAGTENPLFIYALYQLLLELNYNFEDRDLHIGFLNDIVRANLIKMANDLKLNLTFNELPNAKTSPYIINFAFEGIEGESVLTALEHDSLATTSACNSEVLESSYVLKALGVPSSIANCALRMSFNYDSIDDVMKFLNVNFKNAIKKLAQLRVRKTR